MMESCIFEICQFFKDGEVVWTEEMAVNHHPHRLRRRRCRGFCKERYAPLKRSWVSDADHCNMMSCASVFTEVYQPQLWCVVRGKTVNYETCYVYDRDDSW